MGQSGAVPARIRWFGRLSGAHVVVVLAGLLGGVLTLAALRADAREVRVLVAAHDLRVGATLRSDDLRSITVHGDVGALTSLVPSTASNRLIGAVIVAPLRRGDALRASDVAATAAARGSRAVSFAVDAADAVGGNLNPGDRVDVLAVARDGSNAGYVLIGAPVLAVHGSGSSGVLHTNDDHVLITVSVAGDDALRLVSALGSARVIVVNATGAAPLTGAPRYTLPGARNG